MIDIEYKYHLNTCSQYCSFSESQVSGSSVKKILYSHWTRSYVRPEKPSNVHREVQKCCRWNAMWDWIGLDWMGWKARHSGQRSRISTSFWRTWRAASASGLPGAASTRSRMRCSGHWRCTGSRLKQTRKRRTRISSHSTVIALRRALQCTPTFVHANAGQTETGYVIVNIYRIVIGELGSGILFLYNVLIVSKVRRDIVL